MFKETKTWSCSQLYCTSGS